MMTFTDMCGMAACSGSAITLTLSFPSDPALAALHTPETRTLNNPDVPSPYPAGAQLFFRAVTAIHESIFALKVAFRTLRFGDRSHCLLDMLRRSRARRALGSGLCLEPAAGDRSGGQRSHRYCRRAAAVGLCRRAGAPLACGCSPGIWAGCCSEIAPDCAAATLLEACSYTRRCAGGSSSSDSYTYRF